MNKTKGTRFEYLGLLLETCFIFLVEMHKFRNLHDITWKPLRLPTVWSWVDGDSITLNYSWWVLAGMQPVPCCH